MNIYVNYTMTLKIALLKSVRIIYERIQQMKAIICDRCGKIEKAVKGDLQHNASYTLSFYASVPHPMSFKQFELCANCCEDFQTWIEKTDAT